MNYYFLRAERVAELGLHIASVYLHPAIRLDSLDSGREAIELYRLVLRNDFMRGVVSPDRYRLHNDFMSDLVGLDWYLSENQRLYKLEQIL